jgi:hypothetical protein
MIIGAKQYVKEKIFLYELLEVETRSSYQRGEKLKLHRRLFRLYGTFSSFYVFLNAELYMDEVTFNFVRRGHSVSEQDKHV